MSGLLLDTHVWIWYITGNEELSKKAQEIITDAIYENGVYIAAISLWEIAMLDQRQRIILQMPCLEWMNQSLKLTHIHIAPLTPAIAVESCHLPGNFHEDPVDRLITATARVEGLTLVTRDKKMLAYSGYKYVSSIQA
jgi:PIN domain nuclease of toxin-antitoxin system